MLIITECWLGVRRASATWRSRRASRTVDTNSDSAAALSVLGLLFDATGTFYSFAT